MTGSGSISFDRAAESYDETRGLPTDAMDAVVDLLWNELATRQPCLEIGVGTGLIALPLAARGLRQVGLDLSAAMLGRLVRKSDGRPPLALVLGDATRLPVTDGSFGGAIARHVLHLIPDWRAAVAELVRAVRPGGVLLIDVGVHGGPWQELSDRLEAEVGEQACRPGLQTRDVGSLDARIVELGCAPRDLPPIWSPSDLTIERYLRQVDERVHSWTWNVDPEVLAAGTASVRAWARDRYGGLDVAIESRFPIQWRAYDKPSP